MNQLIYIRRLKAILPLSMFLLLLMGKLAAQTPVISSISPVSAAPGSSLTINGNSFNTTIANNIVYIGGIKATVTAASATSLTVTIPNGAVAGPVTVTNTANALTAYSTQHFLPSMLTTKATLTPLDITLSNNKLLNTRIYAMTSADLNNDGKPDLMVSDYGFTNNLSNTLSIIANTSTTAGNISFGAENIYTVPGYNGLAIPATGDFDGDGLLDIASPAILYNPSNNVQTLSDLYILRNTGNLTSFSRSSAFSIPLGTNKAAAADIDGDGKTDVVVVNFSGASVSIIRNISTGVGDINFDAAVTLPMGTSQISAQLADIDGDGKADIISTNGASSGFQVRRNTSTPGSISFASSVTIATAANPESIAVGDVDGDGKLDVVLGFTNTSSNAIWVFHNGSSSGNILFDFELSIPAGNPQQSVTLGDLNGDGKPDLVTGVSNSHDVLIFRNTSTSGSFSFNTTERISLTDPINFARGLIVGDFNNDGNNDVLAGATNVARLYSYRNILQFPPSISSVSSFAATPGSAITISGTNFNTNPLNNAVYFGATKATPSSANSVSLTVTIPAGASLAPLTVLNTSNTLSGQSKNNFLPVFSPNKTELKVTDFISQGTISSTGSSIYGMIAVDLNNDKKPEIVETDRTGNQLFIRTNSSTSGTIDFSTTLTKNLSAYGQPCYPAAGDFDGDGNPDIVVPSFATNSMVVIRNTGSLSTMTVTASFATATNPIAAAVGDIDGDGKPDVVIANRGSSSISVFRNLNAYSGTINFDTKVDFVTGTDEIFAVFITDIDGDGNADIVTQNTSLSNPSFISVFRNTSTIGNITMAARQDFTTLSGPWGMAVGDLDGDGKGDIVVSNSSINTAFSVFRNTSSSGSISFDTRQDIGTAKGQKWVSIGDLNGDGKPDVVLSLLDPVTASNYKVAAFPNTSTSGSISFGTRVDLSADMSPQVNLVQDFDGDGKTDILSGNYDNKNINIHRNALVATPLTQASNLSVSSTGTTATISWTIGSGSKRATFMKEANSGSASPVSNTDYTANTVFGSGSEIASSGWFCVFNGTGNSVTVSGLTPSVTYRIMVIEYNDGNLSNVAQYLTTAATNNPANITTRATLSSIERTTPSVTVNTSSVVYSVNFSPTISGLSASNFSVSSTGITGASVTSVTGNANTYSVTVNTGNGDGSLTLNLANASGISPLLTNTLPFAGQSYTIDKTEPTLTSVTISSNNTITSRARTGDLITIHFTSNESITTPVVTMAGQTAAVTNTGGNNWSASYTMTNSEVDGIIVFNIAFSDLASNPGVAVTATTNSSTVVFDKTAPTLNTVGISSSNSNNARTKVGDLVTIGFTSSESITTPVVTMVGQTASVTNTGGNTWTASYTITSSNADGPITFNIVFADVTGNQGIAVTTTTNSSSVLLDKTPPSLTSVSITSNNINNTKAKTGDIVTISFISNEDILTPTATIAGNAAVIGNSGGNSWTASYTMTTSSTEGVVPFNIVFADITGNQGIAVSATTNSSTVMFDKTAPSLTSVSIASNNNNTGGAKPGNIVTIRFTANESIASPSVIIAGQTASVSLVDGNNWSAAYTMTNTESNGVIAFSISFTDLFGNAGSSVTNTTNNSSVLFDKTIPVLSSISIVSSNSNSSHAKAGDVITLQFTSSEPITTPTVNIATHTVTATHSVSNNWFASYTMSASDAEGTVPFSVSFSDITGNAGVTVTATTNNSSVLFVKTAPVLAAVTIISNNSNNAIAVPGNIVTLNFTSGTSISTPSVNIAGHVVTATNSSGNNWSASYTMTSSDVPGMVAFSIAFNDLHGNTGATVSSTTNNSSIIFSIPPGNRAPLFPDGNTQAISLCTNASATSISNLLRVADLDDGQNLTWNIVSGPNNGTVSGLPFSTVSNGANITPGNIQYQPSAGYTGSDQFIIRVSDGNASADITITVSVSALPAGSISTTQGTVLCGLSASLVLSATDGSSYAWFKDGVAITGSSSQLSVTQTGVYTVQAISAQGCSGPVSQSVTITRLLAPAAQFVFDGNCINTPVQFTNQSVIGNSGSVTYQWSDNHPHNSTALSPSFTYTQAGIFDVKLKVTSLACPALVDSIVKTINITTQVVGIRLPTIDVVKNTLTQLLARTQAGATYSWMPNRFLTSGAISNPQIFTNTGQEYNIVVKTPGGCITVDTLLVRVQEIPSVYLANVFTPNGDGQNDKLIINMVSSIKAIRFFRVYNRWGKMLFETRQPGEGWDGRFNGQLQPMDTYTWVIEAIDENGMIIKKQGTVTLLR
jgi:gliding motility-associated-like protein